MKVLYFGTYESDWSRNRVIIEGLRQNGVVVDECHVAVWEKLADKPALFSALLRFVPVLFSLALAYVRLLGRLVLRVRRYDAVMVGNLGQIDMVMVAPFCRLLRRPLVFNPNVSLTDSVVEDRGLVRSGSMVARLLLWLDRASIAAADLVLLDTDEYIAYFRERFGTPERKLARVFVGAEAYAAVDAPKLRPGADDDFRVLFVGKFTPLHGLEHIVRAAALLLKDPGVSFTIVGRGQVSSRVHALAVSLKTSNVTFIDWMTVPELRDRYLASDVILGVFSTSRKASLVVPNKVYHGLAVGKPVITGDTPAAREVLTHGKSAYLCRVGDPDAIVQAITDLKADGEMRLRIASGGLSLHKEALTPAAIGREAAWHLERLLSRPR